MSSYVKGGVLTVGELKRILNECDRVSDDTPIKFDIFQQKWNLDHYFIRKDELIFCQSGRKIKEMSERFVANSTRRNGSWIEDFQTGKRYHINNTLELGKLLELLNDFDTELQIKKGKEPTDKRFVDTRFHIYYEDKFVRVIKDKLTGKMYDLGISTSIGVLRDYLNEYDYLLNGGDNDLPYQRALM